MASKNKDKTRQNHFGPFVLPAEKVSGAPSIGLSNTEQDDLPKDDTIILVVANCKTVNVRHAPAMTSEIRTQLKVGDRVIQNSNSDGWAFVQGIEDPSVIGFIKSDFLVGEEHD